MSNADPLHHRPAAHDAEAFAQIVEEYQRMVFGTCRRTLHDPNNIEDATQETFMRLARKAERMHTHLGAWLHRCAMNVAIDFNRRSAARRRHESAAAKSELSLDESQRALAELREHLDAAMEKLDEDDRELIIQRFFTGRPQTELATEAGVSAATLSYRMNRAIENLRKYLEIAGGLAATANWTQLLDAENASNVVPAKLTSNLMKVALATPAIGIARSTLLIKSFLAVIILLVTGIGGWLLVPRSTTSPTLPAIVAAPNNASPLWQTTQPTNQPSALAGRVVDDAGHALGGATVELDEQDSVNFDGKNFPFVRVRRTTIGADGDYAFPADLPTGTYILRASAEGFVSIDRDPEPKLEMAAGSQTRRNIVLPRGVLVAVSVMDALGEPVNRARVAVFGAPNHRGTVDVVDGVYTDETGVARMTLPPSVANYTLAVQAAGFAPGHKLISAKLTSAIEQSSFSLLPGRTVKGVAICSDGKPAAGWKMIAVPEWWMGMFDPEPALIDSSGNFTLRDIGPGPYRLMIESHMQGAARVIMPPAHQPIRVDLPIPSPGAPHLKGTVIFAGGRPSGDVDAWALDVEQGRHAIIGLKQYFIRIPPPSPGEQSLPQPIDFGVIPPGQYELQFSAPDIESLCTQNFTAPGVLPPITLKVIGIARLNGIVVDAASGKPITHFAVRSSMVENDSRTRLVPAIQSPWIQVGNPRGEFHLTPNGPGFYIAQVSADGYATIASPVIHIHPAAMTGLVRIKLRRK